MNPILRNILAVLAGIIFGGAVNMSLITVSGSIIPPPAGADLTTVEGINAALPLLQPKHFIFPFLAHALGAFASAFLAATLAVSHKMKIAAGLGVFSLLGGIAAVLLIPAPTWFMVLDLVAAYIPMGYLAGKLAVKK
jgi:hypothetical protein